MALYFILLIFVLIHLCFAAIEILIRNVDVVIQNQANEALSIEYIFEEAVVPTAFITESEACLMIDGTVCMCFANVHSIVWSERCSTNDQDSFLSVLLRSKERSIASLPTQINAVGPLDHLITLILPLTLDDLSRAVVLFHSLKKIHADVVHQLIVLVPDAQQEIMSSALFGISVDLNFTVNVEKESTLFHNADYKSSTYPYAIQMAIKLLCARMIQTRYYLTLDADVVLNHELTATVLSLLLQKSPSDGITRAVYENEARSVHPEWWIGSEAVLGLRPSDTLAGIGVTPVFMSTYGSLLTLNRILKALGCSETEVVENGEAVNQVNCDRSIAETRWLSSFGRNGVLWSEYTLYRLALDYYEVFDGLHVEQTASLQLHCNDVWFQDQLPWHQLPSVSNPCLFSVVQSSTGVSPASVLNEIISTV